MKHKYKVFIVGDESKRDLNALSKKKRLQYISQFINPKFVCECGAPLNITKDGRFVDVPHCKIKHKEDCERYKDSNKRRFVNYVERTMSIIPIYNPNITGKSKGTKSNPNPNGLKTFYYETLSFVNELILESYNSGRQKINLIIHDLLVKLNSFNKISVRGLKNATTKFYCGKLTKIETKERCICISFLAANGETYKKNLRTYEYDYAAKKFKNTYKVDLNDSMDVLFVMSKSTQGSIEFNIPYFILISKESLPCESQLEQTVYNYLDNYLKNHKEIVFRKPYSTECYPLEGDHSYLEDGILQLINDNSCKKVVLEVFGMRTNKYLKNKKIKKEIIASDDSLKLLDYDLHDGLDTFEEKLNKCIEWLKG